MKAKRRGRRGRKPTSIQERRAAFIERYGSRAFDRLWNAVARLNKTLGEIAKDFNVSRQAVEGWTKSLALPYDPRRRVIARRQAIMMARWKKHCQHHTLRVLAERAAEAGVAMEPCVTHYGGYVLGTRHVLLNHRRCHVQGANRVYKGEYAHFGTPNRYRCDCEFSAFVWLPEQRVFIVPRRAIGRERHLYFRLSERRSNAGRKNTFQWARFEDGWRLLGSAPGKKRGLNGHRRERGNDPGDIFLSGGKTSP